MKSLIAIGLFAILYSTASFAEAPADNSINEKKKAKIVSRLYQATYGSIERCKEATPDASQEFKNELDRFVEINANLVNLMTRSPYYEAARKQFANHFNVDPALDTTKSLSGECKYLASLLRDMNDNPSGKKAAKEYEVLLSN